MTLSQGACFMKFAAVEPKKQPSRLARSKSGRSIEFSQWYYMTHRLALHTKSMI